MKPFSGLFILLFIIAAPLIAFASGKAELNLWKRDPNWYGPCGHCADFINFYENENRKDFFNWTSYTQTGYYTIDLTGPEGTMVTLFGRQKF